MKKSFTLGAVAGASSFLIAVPLLAQFAGAQSASSSTTSSRSIPSQACVQAMVALEDAHLANFDAIAASHKRKMQGKRDALATVAAIVDDAQRQGAMQKMHEELRADMKGRPTPPAEATAAMENVREVCGGTLGFRGGFHKGFGMHHKMAGKRGGMFHRWMKPDNGSVTQQ